MMHAHFNQMFHSDTHKYNFMGQHFQCNSSYFPKKEKNILSITQIILKQWNKYDWQFQFYAQLYIYLKQNFSAYLFNFVYLWSVKHNLNQNWKHGVWNSFLKMFLFFNIIFRMLQNVLFMYQKKKKNVFHENYSENKKN